MGEIFLKLLNMSIAASWLILAVLILRLLFKKMPKWVSCLLWGIVAIRLICPLTIESAYSLIPSGETVQINTVVDGAVSKNVPTIDSEMEIVKDTINPILSEAFAYEEEAGTAPLQILTQITGIVWCCGMVVLLAYAIISQLRIRRMVQEAVLLKDPIYICDAVTSPFILGIIRPRIFLPSGMEAEYMNYVIAHEQAHLKRRDHLWKPLGYLLLSVYWFHPLCWAAYVLLCKDIELACDEKVIRDMALEEKKEYAKALLSCSRQGRMVMACPLAFGEISVKERVKSVLNYKKAAFWMIAAAVGACIIAAVCFLTNPPREYEIRVTIAAGCMESFSYSDEEICPKSGTITLYAGEGLGDTEVVLLPVEAKEEKAYEPTYITPGMPVKLQVEKGTWYKIGVNMQNTTAEDKSVYISVENVEVRIEDAVENDTKPAEGTEEANTEEQSAPQRHDVGDLDGNGEAEYLLISNENSNPDYEGHLSFYFNGESIYEYDDILRIAPGIAEYIDLDGDGEREIFFNFYPYVNSTGLVEYAVLKQTGNGWEPLEMIHGETMLDNQFPISILYGEKKNTILISCEGIQKQIIYDVTDHYEKYINDYQKDGVDPQAFIDILEGNLYTEGDHFGSVAAWGIWSINSGTYERENCLIATHGLLGPEGKQDLLGLLDVYFSYNQEGQVQVVNMELREN